MATDAPVIAGDGWVVDWGVVPHRATVRLARALTDDDTAQLDAVLGVTAATERITALASAGTRWFVVQLDTGRVEPRD